MSIIANNNYEIISNSNKINQCKSCHHNVEENRFGKSRCTNVRASTLVNAENTPADIEPLTSGVIAKVPVVLAELTVQANLDSIIELPEPAIEIKDIRKHLKITQCLLLQDTNMLFIKGFVRKNIDYSTLKCANHEGMCGDIKHCTVDVPFKLTTPIEFNGIEPAPIINRSESEFQYFRKRELYGPEFADKDKLLSGDLSEFNKTTNEYFNELPYCELVSCRIVEFDEYLNPIKPRRAALPVDERLFKKIEEKMVIYITLKILQKRQVAIGAVEGSTPPNICDK